MTVWRTDLERRWAEPHRVYHARAHLTEVLEVLDALQDAGEPFDGDVVRTAAWFHDAVYDPRRADNEERSAELALNLLSERDDPHEVARLVRVTRTHDVAADDPDAAALCDADLAVLGRDPARYSRYTDEIRREYAHVTDTDFAHGRATILAALLSRAYIYTTPSARTWWESAARTNLSAELTRLTPSR